MARRTEGPDRTAERVALWRALHLQVDPPPHVLVDELGLRLAGPEEGWRSRPDMEAKATSRARASIVSRARFIEDLVAEQVREGVAQYVILGAGLDTFAQRKVATPLRIFEIDKAAPQAWKRQRLLDLGLGLPDWLRLVPTDFETGPTWWESLSGEGFDAERPAVVASTGVAMYLTSEANEATLRQLASLAPGSTLVMSFLLPLELVDAEERAARELTEQAARAAGTPFVSFYAPRELVALARDSGFRTADHVSAANLAERYFTGRTDGLRPSSSEELLVATL